MIDIGERLRGGGFDSDLVPEGFELMRTLDTHIDARLAEARLPSAAA